MTDSNDSNHYDKSGNSEYQDYNSGYEKRQHNTGSQGYQNGREEPSQPVSARRRQVASQYAQEVSHLQSTNDAQAKHGNISPHSEDGYNQHTEKPIPSQREQPQMATPAAPMNNFDEEGPDPYASEPVVLEPCPHCGRKFKPKVLARHLELKVCLKKRKTFNIKRVEEKVKVSHKDKRKYEEAKKKKERTVPKWKRDRNALREAMRQGKIIKKALAEGVDLSTLPPPKPAHDDRTPCPHCGRKFNADVAERHIPRCRDIKAKPKRLVAKRHAYGGVRKGSRR